MEDVSNFGCPGLEDVLNFSCHGMEEDYRPECDVTVFPLWLAFLCIAGEGELCL